MIIFALLTSSVHFVQLTVVRQLQSTKALVPDMLQFYPWPSTALALDLLAWDLFLGWPYSLPRPFSLAMAYTRRSGPVCSSAVRFVSPAYSDQGSARCNSITWRFSVTPQYFRLLVEC